MTISALARDVRETLPELMATPSFDHEAAAVGPKAVIQVSLDLDAQVHAPPPPSTASQGRRQARPSR